MRILLLTMYFGPDPAANAVIMTKLTDELIALGHEVTVVTTFPHYDKNRIWDPYRGKLWARERRGALDVWRSYLYVPQDKTGIFGRILNYLSFNFLSLIIGLTRRNHDIILSPSPPLSIGFIAYLLSLAHRAPYIYNVQDIYPDIAVRLGILTNQRAIRFFEKLEKFVYEKAAAVSVLSGGFRNNLLRKGVPSGKIAIIPNFIDTEKMIPVAKCNDFTRAHNLCDKFVVMYAGNVGLSQGLETVLDSAESLQSHPDIHFVIVGNGAAKDELVRISAEKSLINITFLPFQPIEDVPNMYGAADVSLVVLRKGIGNESVPSKAQTIMASGRAMIASVDEDSDTHELIKNAQCGLWTPPESVNALSEAILILYNDRSEGDKMGQLGREHVVSHSAPQSVAKAYSDLFEKIGAK